MIVAAADVGIHHHAPGNTVDDSVVEVHIELSHSIGVGLTAVECLAALGITEHAPGAVVQLQAAAAGLIQGMDKVGIGLDQILPEGFPGGIDSIQAVAVGAAEHLIVELGRSRNGLTGDGTVAYQIPQELEVLQEGVTIEPDGGNDASGVGTGFLIVEEVAMLADDVFHTLKAPHEVQMPVAAAELTIGDAAQTG